MFRQFQENEIPYSQLREYGITREMFLNLPRKAISMVMNGKPSPLLILKTEDGRRIPSKIRLVRDEQNRASIVFIPRLRRPDMERYGLNAVEEDKLRKGDTILKGEKYLKLDKDTNQMMEMNRRELRLEEKMESILGSFADIELGNIQKNRIREGKPVTVEKGDTKLTVGIDMNATTGIRIIRGDMDEWRRKQLIEWDRITPGATGYWQTSENGWEYKKFVEKQQGLDRKDKKTQQKRKSKGFSMSMSGNQ